MAYDLLRLRLSPGLVVLSACDTGMARAPADGAPLGLAGTFLDRGRGAWWRAWCRCATRRP
nr:hypothetical protein GCM10020093_044710 [Planobispora longispora]